MALPSRLGFGIFLAPFHAPFDNPTLALQRDLELLEWLDSLGYDVAWIGEQCDAGIARMQEKQVVKPLYSGLFVPDLSPQELAAAVEVSTASGAAGISLYNDDSMSDAHWGALAAVGRR